jgi:DNA adenine methylase
MNNLDAYIYNNNNNNELNAAVVPHDKIPLCYPFVKWAGGKSQLLTELYPLAPPEFNRYFEPFLGGGAMFFYLISVKNKRFTAAYLSDINSELINSYIVVKDNVEKLIEFLKLHEIGYKKAPAEYYYKLRSNDKKILLLLATTTNNDDDIERAARFIALNRTCFNGLYRVNRNGMFNVPLGKYKNPLICNSSNLRNVSLALGYSKATIRVSDYKKILLGNAIEELADIFRKLDDRKCKVLLSNSSTPLIKELYSDFAKYTKEVDARRSINSKGTGRKGDHKELLIRNYS